MTAREPHVFFKEGAVDTQLDLGKELQWDFERVPSKVVSPYRFGIESWMNRNEMNRNTSGICILISPEQPCECHHL